MTGGSEGGGGGDTGVVYIMKKDGSMQYWPCVRARAFPRMSPIEHIERAHTCCHSFTDDGDDNGSDA